MDWITRLSNPFFLFCNVVDNTLIISLFVVSERTGNRGTKSLPKVIVNWESGLNYTSLRIIHFVLYCVWVEYTPLDLPFVSWEQESEQPSHSLKILSREKMDWITRLLSPSFLFCTARGLSAHHWTFLWYRRAQESEPLSHSSATKREGYPLCAARRRFKVTRTRSMPTLVLTLSAEAWRMCYKWTVSSYITNFFLSLSFSFRF